MERQSAWKKYTAEQLEELEDLAGRYRTFISENKTERECVRSSVALAEAAGYKNLDDAIASGKKLKAGSKVYVNTRGKALTLFNIGTRPLSEGLDILGAHVDSPRLDVKQNPAYEKADMAFLDTHYYGGLKTSLWVATPLAIHGVVAKKDGTVVDVVVGEDPADPVFCISDILIHLGGEQMKKTHAEAVDAEALDVIVGGKPVRLGDAAEKKAKAPKTRVGKLLSKGADAEAEKAEGEADEPKEPVKQLLLNLLAERYGIEEEDLLSAELEIVPAGPARDMGLDRSMILGYGHDDRVCAYTSLEAMLAVEKVERTSCCLLVDKEEIGSVGATGMQAHYFENALAEVMALTGEESPLALRRALANSRMLSSDVSAGFDPAYAGQFEEKNSAYLGRGLCFNKYTGARGKSGSNDADAEYMALVRDIMDEADVSFQTCELGRVNAGGGGTIAYIMARYGMDVIDSGVPVLSMHSLWEVANKADIYEAYRGYKAFIERA